MLTKLVQRFESDPDSTHYRDALNACLTVANFFALKERLMFPFITRLS
jgi:hypothetical protein